MSENGIEGSWPLEGDQKNTQRLLREIESERRRLADIFQYAPSFMAVLRGPQHIFERVNDRYRELIGGRQVIGLPVREALPEIEGQGYFELLDHVFQTGTPQSRDDARVIMGDPPFTRERILQFVYQPMLDADGTVSGVIVQGLDMTEQRMAEANLVRVTQESERRKRLYETILSNTPDLAYVFDLDHRFTYANEGLLKMWGRTWDEAIGKTCLELGYEPWHAAMHDREIEEVKSTGKPLRGEVPFHGTFGRRIYDYIFVPVLNSDGQVEAVAGTTRDVTERKEAEESLRDADRKKDDFIALLAHELRNPLAPIRTGLQVIRLLDGQGVTTDAREMMERQLGHMIRMIDDLLDVSRISRNKMELRLARVSMADVISNAMETAQPMIESAKHEFAVSLPNHDVYLNADLTRLSQVFSNLLTNSAKYTEPGGAIWLTGRVVDGGWVISVKDTGWGIPAESLPTIFDMFSQVNRNTELSAGGLGIGLALVKGLVEMHGGTVTVRSEGLGRGSEFTVWLPSSNPATNSHQVDEASPALLSNLINRRILVVDDNVDAAKSMAQMLKLLGNETMTAHDGIEAVDLASEYQPDLVLMDVGMPRLNGLDATYQIRNSTWGQSIIIIALTGWGQEADRERTRRAGFDGHLTKPVDICSLSDLLQRLHEKSTDN